MVSQDPDVMPEEIDAMKALFAMADGTKTLSALFSRLSHLSTAIKWRAAALLLQYQLMQMKVQ
jgi:hypothetical protein